MFFILARELIMGSSCSDSLGTRATNTGALFYNDHNDYDGTDTDHNDSNPKGWYWYWWWRSGWKTWQWVPPALIPSGLSAPPPCHPITPLDRSQSLFLLAPQEKESPAIPITLLNQSAQSLRFWVVDLFCKVGLDVGLPTWAKFREQTKDPPTHFTTSAFIYMMVRRKLT